MATQVQFRRGTTAQHSSFTGAVAEITVDTDKETVVVHDGSTAGGFPLATEANYVTKTDALNANNALKALIDDRLQVANAAAIYQTIANERAALANTNNRLNTLEAGGTLATNTYIVANYLQKTSSGTQSTAGEIRVDSSDSTSGVHIKDGSIVIFSGTGSPAFMDFYCEVSNAHRTRLKSAAHSDYSGNSDITLPTTSGTLALQSSVDTLTSTVNSNLANTNAYIATKLDTSTASSTYVTKTDAVSSNNEIVSLINDRLQVANAASIYAPLASPTLTGTPAAPTAAGGTNTTQIATTAFVRGEVSGLVDSAPASLDTLNELAAALGDDANFSTTVTNLIGTKLAVSNANLTIAADSGTNDVVSIVTDVLTIAGDTGITTTVSDNQISIDLDDTAVTPGSYGNTTAIPVVTVDQQGRLTSVSTSAISSALTIAADSGSNDTVTVGTDTLTFAGTTNEIETTVTNNQIQIGLVASPQVTGLTATGTIAAANFNSTSDQRLKKNIEDSADSSEIIDNIKVRQFDWIEDDKHQQYGFVAQELVEVFPDAVVKGLQDDDIWRIDYNQVVPLLVKEIQQLRARIEKLESN